MHWKAKALAFWMLERPGGDALHYFLQRHITRTWPRPVTALDALWAVAQRVLGDCRRHGLTRPSVLEIGSGRDLAVPLALNRLGVERIVAADVARLARLDLVGHAARHMSNKAAAPLAGTLETWADLERLGIAYRAPERNCPSGEVFDCSCSNEVLEHVPRTELPELIRALKAATRRGGISTHSIDYSDHYARSDRNLSRFNFLTFTDTEWARYNSSRQHVNRLRHSDYVRLFREAGFAIVHATAVVGDPPMDLRARLAPQFRSYEESDLFSLKGHIVAIS